jgi:hypothetical protein
MRAPRKGQAGAFNISRDIRDEARITMFADCDKAILLPLSVGILYTLPTQFSDRNFNLLIFISGTGWHVICGL